MSRVKLSCNENELRVWLQPLGHECLAEFISTVLSEHHEMICQLPSSGVETVYYDVFDPFCKFALFQTDYYPPDGYESLFVFVSDLVPSPWGMLNPFGAGRRCRSISIALAKIVHDPYHAEHAVANLCHPRLRPSSVELEWGFDVEHIWQDGSPTNEYSFHCTSSDVRSTSHLLSLLSHLGVEVVTTADINDLQSVRDLERASGISIIFEDLYEERWDSDLEIWRGFVKINERKGFFGSRRDWRFVE